MPEEDTSNLFGGSVDRSKLEEMKAAAGDDPERQRQVAEVQAQVDAVAESDAAAEQAREEAIAQSVAAGTTEPEPQPEVEQPEGEQPAEVPPETQPEQTEYTEADFDALRAEAEQLGVKVDGRWGYDRLRSEVEAAREG